MDKKGWRWPSQLPESALVGMYVCMYVHYDRYKKLPICNTHLRLFFNYGGVDRVRNVSNET